MDNWIFLFLGLILGIPLSIFANYATPYVISYFKNRSLSRRERRIKLIINQYKRVKEYKENPLLLVLTFIEFLSWGLVILGVMVYFSMSVEGLSSYVISFIFFYVLYYMSNLISKNIDRIRKFDEFEKEIFGKLEKLGGNPEDLDKVETE